MSSLLNRLFLWQKFCILALIALILIALPLVLYEREASKAIDVAESEVSGLPPVHGVTNAVLLVQQHRGMSAMFLSGNDAVAAQRTAKQGEIDKAFDATTAILANSESPDISAAWKEARERWKTLPSKVAERKFSPQESFAAHTALIEQMLALGGTIMDRHRLSLDPEADSYNLIDASLLQTPDLIETLGRLRARGSAILTAGSATIGERATIMALVEKAGSGFASVRAAADKAIAANPAIRDKLAGPMQATVTKGEELIKLARKEIVEAEQFAYPGPDFFAKVTATIGEQVQFQEAALKALEEILHAREDKLVTTSYLLTGTVLLSVLLAGFLCKRIIDSISQPLHEAVDVAQRAASGDLGAHIEVRYANETGKLLQALKDMNAGLSKIVSEVRSGTETMVAASSQIASGNLDLSSRTEQEASSLEETASTMEEITSTVKLNADNARKANQLALSASEVASKGGEMVADVVATMTSINESSRQIVDIIGVIDGIAFQTNILALNAAVEAARAGEQGRGFAVVATEVRNLAQRAAAAAKEIKALINNSVEKIDVGTRLVDQTGATMNEIVGSIKHVAGIISEIAAATDEQSSGIEQMNSAIMQIDQVTQKNAALVEEAAAAAKAMQDQAANLAGVVSVFQLDDEPALSAQTAPAKVADARQAASARASGKANVLPLALATSR